MAIKFPSTNLECFPRRAKSPLTRCDDFENCTGYQKCRKGRFDDYTVNYAEAEQFNIEYCDEITGNFHCDVGYYTNATTLIIEQAVCKDFCPPGKTTSRSCSALREGCAEFCHIENVDSSKDENWCNLEQRSCVCKKGYKQPNCEKCPPDKTGDNCSRDCKIECGNVAGATCDGPTCLCPPGYQNQANQCRQCDNGFYGQDCAGTCISSREDACYEAHSFSRLSPEKCDKVTGSCICVPGFDPAENCQSACKEFMWGGGEDNCQSCSCKNLMECDRITGECL
ncbi:multiple epidermal growth factor-like domains protein 10, partial [Symsagittifera roscoffensis]|uniref:multiple epidermal growth factor-like domains protein 10 n=1 Tax=Symsagittifera roscoffensis TaxID=84072 RepID=UPI00307B4BE7